MKGFIGIDLGSTTTKAVILDEHERLLGRGITNSRSNYDVACAVARSEAFINARFGLFHGRLAEAGLEVGLRERLSAALEKGFNRCQHEIQLEALDQALHVEAAKDRYRAVVGELEAALESILGGMQGDVAGLFSPTSARRPDFFRDMASAGYMRRAEAYRGKDVTFDLLMSTFDKSIIKVENQELDLSFSANVYKALDGALEACTEVRPHADLVGEIVEEVAAIDLCETGRVGTGYGRSKLPFHPDEIRSEILCHGLGAHWMFPKTATVLDIGGQDTKAIQVDPSGIVTSFQMNDRCAAGCGRYLGYIADEMNLGLHELGPLAKKACRTVRITSTCTVFAGAELRDRLTLGEKREDILAGLHRAMMLRAMSLLARSGGIDEEFTFTGGVAKNPAAVEALEKLVKENYGERTINISADSIYTGAVGAALFARRDHDAAGAELAGTGGVNTAGGSR